MAFLDYSEIMIGAPRSVTARLTGRIGELAMSSTSLRTGLTAGLEAASSHLERSGPWRVMKLLWVTHSFRQAQEMADLLRAWDGKLFLADPALAAGMDIDSGHTFHAFVVLS